MKISKTGASVLAQLTITRLTVKASPHSFNLHSSESHQNPLVNRRRDAPPPATGSTSTHSPLASSSHPPDPYYPPPATPKPSNLARRTAFSETDGRARKPRNSHAAQPTDPYQAKFSNALPPQQTEVPSFLHSANGRKSHLPTGWKASLRDHDAFDASTILTMTLRTDIMQTFRHEMIFHFRIMTSSHKGNPHLPQQPPLPCPSLLPHLATRKQASLFPKQPSQPGNVLGHLPILIHLAAPAQPKQRCPSKSFPEGTRAGHHAWFTPSPDTSVCNAAARRSCVQPLTPGALPLTAKATAPGGLGLLGVGGKPAGGGEG
ncbi:hypothetical protein BJ508DRAFT_327970 [Ascobolus immersus RN42]|uniref:Uncharacterized protein n=1 Tax=Ascobolus immersus RN42 TaxID=1160509 RepID=A0A3N4I2P5_ASCIM|nr:hypothetical protein BJ508DRAFT_327970 [Ascobolus immersus RN42]